MEGIRPFLLHFYVRGLFPEKQRIRGAWFPQVSRNLNRREQDEAIDWNSGL
jgi:hypothetical protein